MVAWEVLAVEHLPQGRVAMVGTVRLQVVEVVVVEVV